MCRDLKFAVCHTNKAIKKSTEFRNMDMENALQLVPPKELVYNENFELVIPKPKNIRILKSRTICGDYHTIPLEISPDREMSSEQKLNKIDCCKTNLKSLSHKNTDVIRNNQSNYIINNKMQIRHLEKSDYMNKW
jgi:hypothetical protein